MHLLLRSKLSTLMVLSFAHVASAMPCADRSKWCALRRAFGQCHWQQQSMAYYCALTCGMCPLTTTTTPPPSCADRLSDCAARQAGGQCQEHQQSMAYYCARTCGACRGGGPSGQCKPLGSVTRSMQNALNLVFLPSGFQGNMALFRQKVQQIYPLFQKHAAFSSDIPALNYYIAEAEVTPNDDGRYCTMGCFNIDRLLCCQLAHFDRLSNRVCGSGGVVNKIVVHNADHWYGGAGAPNGATLSTNPQAMHIAVHEVGHSLLNLADEYSRSDASTPHRGNCDSVGCRKWADLIGKFGVGCHAGFCKNGLWYASYTNTLMGDFGGPHLGAVSERLACCKYLMVTSFEPNFCKKFTGNGLNLRQFCASSVWRNTGRDVGSGLGWPRNASLTSGSVISETEDMIRRAHDDTQGMIYRYIRSPRAFAVEQDLETGLWTCSEEGDTLEAGLYPQNQVEGDQMADANLNGEGGQRPDDLILVAAHDDGRITRIPYHKYETFEVPRDPSTNSSGGNTLRVPRTYFRAILDTSSLVRTCFVQGQDHPLPWGLEKELTLRPISTSASPAALGAASANANVMSGSDILSHNVLPLLAALACLALN